MVATMSKPAEPSYGLTVRIAASVHVRAREFAYLAGMSTNALYEAAMREYLDRHSDTGCEELAMPVPRSQDST
jgi:hypothetical protein